MDDSEKWGVWKPKKIIRKVIVTLIILWVGSKCIDEVLYEYYLHRGYKLRAWLIRPIYGFKMYWID